MAFRRPWRHRHLFLETRVPEGPGRTQEPLCSAHILPVPASARWGSGAGTQGKGATSPHPPVCAASNIPNNFACSFLATCLHPGGQNLPLGGMGCEVPVSSLRCQSPERWAGPTGCSWSSGAGRAGREDQEGQLSSLKAGQCCRKKPHGVKECQESIASPVLCTHSQICASRHTAQRRNALQSAHVSCHTTN